MSKSASAASVKPDSYARGYKIRAYLSEEQEHKLRRYIGSARFVKNWALQQSLPRYGGLNVLSKALTKLRHEADTAWLSEVPRTILQQALQDVDAGFQRFFQKLGKYPKRKKRKANAAGSVRFQLDQRHMDYVERESWRPIQSQRELKRACRELGTQAHRKLKDPDLEPEERQFRRNLENCSIEKLSRWAYVRLPGLGRIKLRRTEALRGKLATITLALSGLGEVFAVFTATSIPLNRQQIPEPKDFLISNDAGFRTWATLYNGSSFRTVPPPPALPKLVKQEKKLRTKLNRKIREAKKEIGVDPSQKCPRGVRLLASKKRDETRIKLAKASEKLAVCRRQAVHELSDYLTREARIIVLENLNVKGICQGFNRAFRRKAHHVSFGELRRQVLYKAKLRERFVVLVDRFYPSSKECSGCHEVNKDLKLQKYWTCQHCGQVHDRDLNAAVNLYREALRMLLEELTITATAVKAGSKARGGVIYPRMSDSAQCRAQILTLLRRELVYPPTKLESFLIPCQEQGIRKVG